MGSNARAGSSPAFCTNTLKPNRMIRFFYSKNQRKLNFFSHPAVIPSHNDLHHWLYKLIELTFKVKSEGISGKHSTIDKLDFQKY